MPKNPKTPLKSQRSYRLHNTASVVKVNTRSDRVVESPDDVQQLKIKESELVWIFNNVKNGVIQKINY